MLRWACLAPTFDCPGLQAQLQLRGLAGCCDIPRAFGPRLAIRRVLFQDAAGGLFLYDAQRGELMVPPDWAGGQLRSAVWDGADQRLVAAASSTGELWSVLSDV